MARFGFVGPSYTSQSILADCQRLMNWYVETIESPSAKSQLALYPTPGLTHFANVDGPIRGMIEVADPTTGKPRFFTVGGAILWELNSQGAFVGPGNMGNVGNDFLPVTIVTNGSAGNQIAICSAGKVYVFYLKDTGNNHAGDLIEVGGIQGQASQLVFCDGYGVVTIKNSNKFQSSTLEDMSQWSALSVQQVSVFSGNIGAMVEVFRQIWFFGLNGESQVYYNSGANQFTPFDVIQGAYMEEGINAPLSLCVLDNAPFWIGGNENGTGIAWRANGYAPVRVSNFAIETAWAAYPAGCSDAVGFSYRDQGHTFWVLRFPSANNGFGATWCYDVATQMWHERGYWSQEGFSGFSASLACSHCFAFNKHFVGDVNPKNGTIYEMSIKLLDDNGNPIRRLRRAPHVSSEDQRIFHNQMQIAVEVGDGPQPPLLDGAGNPRGPQMMLRWSNDGGRTWSNEHWANAGQAGKYLDRVFWNRLGYARDRIYEVAVTDPIPWRIVDAYLKATPGFSLPTERYSSQIAKMA